MSRRARERRVPLTRVSSTRLAVGEAKEMDVDTSKEKGTNKNQSQQKTGQNPDRSNDRSREQSDSMRDQDRSDRSRSSNDR